MFRELDRQKTARAVLIILFPIAFAFAGAFINSSLTERQDNCPDENPLCAIPLDRPDFDRAWDWRSISIDDKGTYTDEGSDDPFCSGPMVGSWLYGDYRQTGNRYDIRTAVIQCNHPSPDLNEEIYIRNFLHSLDTEPITLQNIPALGSRSGHVCYRDPFKQPTFPIHCTFLVNYERIQLHLTILGNDTQLDGYEALASELLQKMDQRIMTFLQNGEG